MKQLTGNQTRQMFLDFFKSKGHMIEPGASLVPHNDPTLLWINAGVAALKKYFDGTEKPACNRIANAQKSIRTNDIENVGKTARHHTFFEMLGNFSIGDYFKEEAIPFAWEFLTSEEWIGMPKEKMYISVYTDDDDAYNIWVNKCGVDPSHILRTYENFWEIGKGPGGPDSEIFYDRGEQFDPEGLGERLFFEEMENDRYTEVWNVVFSQYDCDPELDRKDYKELPHKNIDTGMGLERLVSIIQGGETNFDTDLFLPIIHATEKMAKVPYADNKMAYRVIADHIRTVTFALSDGAMFDKAGRGYVLRRILRRAVRYGKKIGIDHSFMYELVPVVADMMKEFYDYLPEKVPFVSAAVKKEEEAFQKTLVQGEKRIKDFMEHAESKVIDGSTAFMLYDTYGFPLELTVEIGEEYGFEVDQDGFAKEMKAQQERARAARGDDQSMTSQKVDLMDFTVPSDFTYDPSPITAQVTGVFKDGEKCDCLTDEGEIIVDHTTFYAEMGGQCADYGFMKNDQCTLQVVNVLKAPNGQHLHYVKVINGEVRSGDQLQLLVDTRRRMLIENNHTATHLLDAALQAVLGDHVAQAGSYVDDQRLRFDFTHPSKMTPEEIKAVEDLVNKQIFNNLPVTAQEMPKEEALASGAIALFDEKYGDTVRVVSAGDFSRELCGGCHAPNTGRVGLFKIELETSIGSGIRRIEAISSEAAYQALKREEEVVSTIAALLKMKNRHDVVNRVNDLVMSNAKMRKEIDVLTSKLNVLEAKDKARDVEVINGVKFLNVHVDADAKAAKQMVFDYRDQLGSGVVFLTSSDQGKHSYFVGVSKDLTKKIKAGDLVKAVNGVLEGRGGGKPDIAQGGCASLEKESEAVALLKSML